MRRVRELAELPRDEEGGLLADVDGVVADPLEATGNEHHPHSPLEVLMPELEDAPDDAAVGAVDQLVQIHQRLGEGSVTRMESPHRDPRHLLCPLAHLAEAFEQ